MNIHNSFFEENGYLEVPLLKTAYKEGLTLNAEPLIHIVDNFITTEETLELLMCGASELQEAFVLSPNSEVSAVKGVSSKHRSGKHAWVRNNHNDVIKKLSERIADLVDVPLSNAGASIQLLHYCTGQQYKPHFDSWDETTERGKTCLAERGQRVLTCLFYLNDVEEGGGTSFTTVTLILLIGTLKANTQECQLLKDINGRVLFGFPIRAISK
jgi:prolyl 4-hydroxylase